MYMEFHLHYASIFSCIYLEVLLKVNFLDIYFGSTCEGQFSCIYMGIYFGSTFEGQLFMHILWSTFHVMCEVVGMLIFY